jgi:hypothetical protein
MVNSKNEQNANATKPSVSLISAANAFTVLNSAFKGPLTADKKLRRLNSNLCAYCGDPKHNI